MADPRPSTWTATRATLALIGLACALLALPADVQDTLRWSADGWQPWQWLSAHLLHLSWRHLAVNAAVAVGLALVADRRGISRPYGVATLVILCLLSLGLHWSPWPLAWYAGASGLLHGLFAWLCLQLRRDASTPLHQSLALLLLLGGGAKVLLSLTTPVGSIGWLDLPQATPAHAYGYLGGLLAGWRRRE